MGIWGKKIHLPTFPTMVFFRGGHLCLSVPVRASWRVQWLLRGMVASPSELYEQSLQHNRLSCSECFALPPAPATGAHVLNKGGNPQGMKLLGLPLMTFLWCPQQAPVSYTDSPTAALCWGPWNLEEVAMTQQKQRSTSGHLRAAPAPDSISHFRFPEKTSHPLPQTPSPRHLSARPCLPCGDPLKPGLQYDFLSLCCCLFLSGILVTTYKI